MALPAAGTAATSAAAAERPRIGLVLGGGTARAFAHVGVLLALEELRVPIDCIAGASMGAFVGGLYASGMPARRLEKLVAGIDWAAISGGDFSLMTRSLVRQADAVEDLHRLPIPLTVIATDLETGLATLLTRGPLSGAMRASVTVPGWIPPYRLGGRLLADGALVDSLPVDAARQMGADVLVVVDLGLPLLSRADLSTALGLSQQIAGLLSVQNAARQLASLRPDDVLIHPRLEDSGAYDFSDPARAIDSGRRAAADAAARLLPLALSPSDYAAHVAARTTRR